MAARKLKVSTTGYKENSKDKNLDRLYVPSPNLTMTNVKKHVKATPVYPNDMYGNPITMIPGVPSYTFPGAIGVIEEKLPKAQDGTFDYFMASKKLNDEQRRIAQMRNQIIPIALSHDATSDNRPFNVRLPEGQPYCTTRACEAEREAGFPIKQVASGYKLMNEATPENGWYPTSYDQLLPGDMAQVVRNSGFGHTMISTGNASNMPEQFRGNADPNQKGFYWDNGSGQDFQFASPKSEDHLAGWMNNVKKMNYYTYKGNLPQYEKEHQQALHNYLHDTSEGDAGPMAPIDAIPRKMKGGQLPQAQLGLDWEALQNPDLAAKAKAMGHNTIAEYRNSNWGYGNSTASKELKEEYPTVKLPEKEEPRIFQHPDEPIDQLIEFMDKTGVMSYDDARTAYNDWQSSGNTFPTLEQGLSMFSAVPGLGSYGKLKYVDPLSIKNVKTFNWQKALNLWDAWCEDNPELCDENGKAAAVSNLKKQEGTDPYNKKQGGELPKAQYGLPNQDLSSMGAENRLYTYKNDANWFDNKSIYHNNSKYSDQIRHAVYSGNYGYNPVTEVLEKLPSDKRTTVSADTKKRLAEGEKKLADHQATIENQQAYRQSIIDAGFDPETFGKMTAEEEKAYEDKKMKDYIIKGHELAINNPVFKTAAYFTPAGVAIGAMEGAANFLPDAYNFAENPSWSAAGKVGMDALMTSPVLGKFLSNVGNKVATGNSLLTDLGLRAWKSPAVGLSQEASADMFKGLLNSGKMTPAERNIVLEYQQNPSSSTGRHGPIDPVKRSALNDIIRKYELQFPQNSNVIATRRFSFDKAGKSTLGADVQGRNINFGDRPTSFSAGLGLEGYQGAPDRLVIPSRYLPKMKNNFIAQEYSAIPKEHLELIGQPSMTSREKLIDFGSGIGTSNEIIGTERELIGTGLDFKQIGKVKNDIGGFDVIVKPRNVKAGTSTTKNATGQPKWVKPSETQLKQEFKVEHQAKGSNYFSSEEEFQKAVNEAKVEEITPEMDQAIKNKSRHASREAMIESNKNYKSWPKYRNENTVDDIYKGMQTGAEMDMPIILEFPDGTRRMFSGNTRMDVAFQSGKNPKALIVKVPAPNKQKGGELHRMQTEGQVSREEKIKKDTERMAYNAAAQTSANWDPQGLNGAPEEPLEYDKKTGKYYRSYYDKASGQWGRQEVVLDIKPKSYGVPAKNAPKKTKEQVEKEKAIKYSQKAKNDPTLWLAEHPEFMLDADGNPVLKSSMEANAPADYLTEQQKALKEEFIRERNAEPLQQSLGTLDNNPQTAAAATRYANTELAGPILEKNPRDKYATRAEWIESFTPQEKAIIEGSNKAYHFDPNTWTTFSRALQTEGNKNTQWQRNLDLTEEEKNRPITAMDRLGVLSPLMLPAQGVQRVLTEPFSTKNFLTGVVLNNWYNGDTPKPYYGDDGTMRDYYQPDAQAIGNGLWQAALDPLNYIGFGAGGIGTELAGDLSKLDNPLANLYKYNPLATKFDDVAGMMVGEGKGAFIADPARNYTAYKAKPNFLMGYREIKDASKLNWTPLIDKVKANAQAKMLENFVTLTGGKADDIDLAQFIDYWKAYNNRWGAQYKLAEELTDIGRAKLKGSPFDSQKNFSDAWGKARDEAKELRTLLEEQNIQPNSPLGRSLGNGAEGMVFELAADPKHVIKVGQTFKTDNVDDLLKSFEGILGDNIAVVKRAHKDGSGLIEIMPNLDRTGKFKNLTKSEVLDKLEADARDLMSRGFFLDVDNLRGNFKYNPNKNVVDIYDVSKPAHGISYQNPDLVVEKLREHFSAFDRIPEKHPLYNRPNSAVSKPVVELTGAEATKRLDAARKEWASLLGRGTENLTPNELLDLYNLEYEINRLSNSVKKLGGTAKPRDHKSLDNYFEAAWTNSRKTN